MSSIIPNPYSVPSSSIKYNELYVRNTKSGRKIRLYKLNKRALNPLVKKLVKENINNISDLPKEYVIDRGKKIIIRKTNAKGDNTASFKKLLANPKQIKYAKSNKLVFNNTNKKYYKRSDVISSNGKLKKWVNNSGLRLFNGVLIYKYTNKFTQFGNVIIRNNGLIRKRIFTSPQPTNNIKNFLQSIKDVRNKKFKVNVPISSQKVLLKIGSLFRWVPMEWILNASPSDLEDMLNNWGEYDWGSDTVVGSTDLISADYLDRSYFMIQTQGINFGHTKTKVNSKYWKCDQPPTKNNCCLEGAINRGLKIGKTAKTLRRDIINHTNNYIQEGQLIDIKDLNIYEDYFKCRIKVYEDTPHYVVDEASKEEHNLIRDTEKDYEPLIKVLYKDNHINLIIGKKLQLCDLSVCEKKMLGIYKKPKTKTQKELNKKKEILVVFDIETVFDKFNDQFLKPYSVSWFVWDKDVEFDYNKGLVDGIQTYDYEPYCYYKNGEGCLEELLKFLLTPPEGIVYRPLGFNNSRFDNFALCEVALNKGVLTNVFYADGSILYTIISGCLPTWDACRFLTGKSLDSACKDYNTNPKKRTDLIDHYTVQCYYEQNGWDGLVALLEADQDLIKYNKLDVLCLLDLTLKMRHSYNDLFNVDVLDYLTLSSMGYKLFKMKTDEYNLNIVNPMTYTQDKFFRESLTAGRTQSFYGKYDYNIPIAMGDIKSLYPTVMGSYGDNDCPYPYGKYIFTKTEVEGKLGIYRVNIKHQRAKWKNKPAILKSFKFIKDMYGLDLYREYAPNVIAKREKDKPLDWFYKDEIENVNLTSVDIEVIRWATEDRDCIEILDGYYWEESRKDIFIHYLDPPRLEKGKQDRLKEKKKDLKKIFKDEDDNFYREKMIELYSEDYNEAKREGCKGISNSLSGKLLEAIHKDVNLMFSSKNFIKLEKDKHINEVEIIDFGNGFSILNGKKDEEFVFEDTKDNKRKPSYLGMFVYSYARKLMYKKLLSRYITLYMDTDSACMPMCEWDRLNNEYLNQDFVNTGEYGCIEEEVCDFNECDKCKKRTPSEKIEYENNNPYINGKRCADCDFTPADRIISIAPKNYMVENIKYEHYSKRKFKGVRKNDFWLPLSYFGSYYKDEKGRNKGDAVDFIHSLNQDDIRRFREFKCCKDCVVSVLDNEENKCEKCKEIKSIMKKTYTTEMFKELEKGNKIAIFCSMINRIQFKISNVIEWEFLDKTNATPTIADLEFILTNFSTEGAKQPIQIKFNINENEAIEYQQRLKKAYDIARTIGNKKEQNIYINNFLTTLRKFRNEDNSMLLKDIFKLKQQYLIKIV